MSRLLNRCELDDSSNYESDKYDYVKNDGEWSDKRFYYYEDLSEDNNF